MSRMLRLSVVMLLLLLVSVPATAEEWRWDGVSRVVAVGDVHGAYEELVSILSQAGLIDAQLQWSGGETHLVSMGDLVDRGARSRDVLELFMALQPAAEAAGGRVHVVLGNHDAMQLSGELEYVSAEEFASYADAENPARREAAYQRFLSHGGVTDGDQAKADFATRYPPGYFGHQAMFAPDGRYGSWILQRPVAIVINGSLFVHGGVSDDLAVADLSALNTRLSGDLADYAAAWAALRDAGVLNEATPFSERPAIAAAAAAADPDLTDAAGRLAAASASPVFTAEGPLWFRGTAWCNENFEVFRVERVLSVLKAQRAVL
ncbi:MAG: metallophosphoesterase, partial [Gammaproteobacteria bacterium]